jgi:hypothetical protein
MTTINGSVSVGFTLSSGEITILTLDPQKGTFSLLSLLCLLYEAVFPEPLFRLKVSMFREIVITRSPSGAFMCKNGSMERLSVDAIARDRNCQILTLNFQCAFQ